MNHLPTIRDRIRSAAARGNWRTALKLGASIAHDLGGYGPIIARAHEAGWHPGFSAQLGRDPNSTVAAGIAAMKVAFNLNEDTNVKTNADKAARKPRSAPRKPAAVPGDTKPASEPEATPEPAQPLRLTDADLAALQTLGAGRWAGKQDGVSIQIARDPTSGMFTATITRGTATATVTTKGYSSSARAAARALADREAGR